MTTFSVLRRLTGLMMRPATGARRDSTCAISIELINIALGVAAPVLLKMAIDLLSNEATASGPLFLLIAGFVVAWAGTNATAAVKYVFTIRIIDQSMRRLVLDAARSQLPLLAKSREGDSARLQGILERLPYSLQIVIDGLIWRAAPLALQTLISLAVLAALVPPQYTIMMTLILAAYALATRSGADKFQKAAQSANEAAASQAQTLGDILRNARRVVFNGNISAELGTIGERIAQRRSANERVARLIAGTAMLQFAVLAAGLGGLLIISATDVAGRRLTVGDFVLLQAYAFRLALPLGGFGYIIRQAGVAIANLAETFDLVTPAAADLKRPSPVPAGPAEIVLDNVGFRYNDDWVIRGASVKIPPGAFVVMIGPNGSGKSTLARIMAGLIEPHEGEVSINGKPLSNISADDRHRLILYTPQTIGFFNRTLRENALYPPTQLNETELMRLLAGWNFYETQNRPIDLDLAIGEQGRKISGGQLQKLELARLAGVNAPAVILDETTSALDQKSEERTVRALRKRYKGRTTLMLITHRIHMARSADLVLFVEQGRIAAEDHETLTVESKAYAKIHGAASPRA